MNGNNDDSSIPKFYIICDIHFFELNSIIQFFSCYSVKVRDIWVDTSTKSKDQWWYIQRCYKGVECIAILEGDSKFIHNNECIAMLEGDSRFIQSNKCIAMIERLGFIRETYIACCSLRYCRFFLLIIQSPKEGLKIKCLVKLFEMMFLSSSTEVPCKLSATFPSKEWRDEWMSSVLEVTLQDSGLNELILVGSVSQWLCQSIFLHVSLQVFCISL